MTARGIAEKYVKSIPCEEPLTLLSGKDREFDVCWVFFYNSVRYEKSRLFSDIRVGTGPLIVDKRDGSLFRGGTGQAIEFLVDQLRSGTMEGLERLGAPLVGGSG